jgi:hypothetical protein
VGCRIQTVQILSRAPQPVKRYGVNQSYRQDWTMEGSGVGRTFQPLARGYVFSASATFSATCPGVMRSMRPRRYSALTG